MDSARRSSFIREKETDILEKKSHSPTPDLSPVFFHFPFRHLVVVTVSLPCTAFLFCIIYSFFYHYEWVTRTHCQVWNIAPSISASIGNFAPEKYVWKICLALHSAPRLLLCQLYHSQMRTALSQDVSVQQAALLSCTANLAEIFSLLLLSVVPSMEDYALHKLSFASFLLFSGLFIATSYYLLSCHRASPTTCMERKSLRLKKNFLITNFTCIAASLYFYWRHNCYCEPGIYSVFSVFEYSVVLSNMAYHFTAYYDFYHVVIQIGPRLPGVHGITRHE